MKKYSLQYYLILEKKFYGMTGISYWLLKSISKKWSIQGEFFFLYESYFWNICLNDEWSYHNAHKGEDKNIDISHGNSLTMLAFNNLFVFVEQKKLKMNHREDTQHYETRWA